MQLRVDCVDLRQVHGHKHRFRTEKSLLKQQCALCRASERQWAEYAVLSCSDRIESVLHLVRGFSLFLPLNGRTLSTQDS